MAHIFEQRRDPVVFAGGPACEAGVAEFLIIAFRLNGQPHRGYRVPLPMELALAAGQGILNAAYSGDR